MQNLWIGYSIYHRSGIFSTSSAFGRISEGSNYNTIYLEHHWKRAGCGGAGMPAGQRTDKTFKKGLEV